MSDDNDNDSKAGGRAPLTLKPRMGAAVSSGVVKQSFSHGRSKTVVVETKRRRMDPPSVNLAGPSAAERTPAPQAQAPRPAPSAPSSAGGLSREEQERRQRVAADFARQQAADHAAGAARRAAEVQAAAAAQVAAPAAQPAAPAVAPRRRPRRPPHPAQPAAPVAPAPAPAPAAPRR